MQKARASAWVDKDAECESVIVGERQCRRRTRFAYGFYVNKD
jgi:hypothetical protein